MFIIQIQVLKDSDRDQKYTDHDQDVGQIQICCATFFALLS
jgi:hypothetical protein